MRVRRRVATLFSFAIACSFPLGAVSAQQGTIGGRVTDAETGEPLAGASVEALGGGGPQGSNEDGQFSLTVPPGTYSLVVKLIGYATTRIDGVSVAVGGSARVDVSLRSQALVLNPVVVTASRRQEKALDAPASIATVSSEEVERIAAVTVADHVTTLPGIDRVQTGLAGGTVVARGFNNVFSGTLLTIIDNRYARVPSLRFNAYSMFPTTDLDIDRIEVSLGPGAALYGPNASSGVMHVITSSPLDEQGSTISLAGGERSLFHGQFRTAQAPTENFGLKISGQYMQGDDWEYDQDPGEIAARAAGCQICTRDYASKRYSVDARMDFRVADDGHLILNGGTSTLASGVEMTGIGAFQVKNWGYNYLQTRFSKGRLFAQYFLNMTNSGGGQGTAVDQGTFGLRTGQAVVDQSRTMAAQFQYGLDVGSRLSFTYGIDWQRTEPRTGGTINGRNEDDDLISEIGGYLHSEMSLGDKLDLVAAIRVDDHSRLDALHVSPRAALVFKPNEVNNFRLTYNRAFATPSANNLFLDIVAARLPPPIDFYDVLARGVPAAGYSFDERCEGGFGSFCMRSPLVPGQLLPANAGLLWDGVMQMLAQLEPELGPITQFLQSPGAIPGDPEIGTVLRRLDLNTQDFLLDAGPTRVDALESTIFTTFEGGYKGLLGGRVRLAADVYRANVVNFVGPLRVETPNAFFDPESTGAFVFSRLGPLIQAGVITEADAAAIVGLLAQLPVGTVVPDQSEDHNLMVTYRNFGEIDYWGADLAADVLLSDRLRINLNYSFMSDDCFAQEDDGECTGLHDIALNAPRLKGSVGFTFDDRAAGFTLGARVRFTDGFPMNSGVYIGRVERYGVVDASIGYELPFRRGTRLSLTANNVANNLHREFVGAPEVGRLLLLRVHYDF